MDAHIRAQRDQIDAIDSSVQELIRRRTDLSREIQQARMTEGQPRIANAREGEILDRWHAALGSPGVVIARAMLELARGNVKAAPRH